MKPRRAEMANFPVVSMTRRVLGGEVLQLAVVCGWPFKAASTLVTCMIAEEMRVNRPN